MAEGGGDGEELPAELEEQCSECHRALAGVERLLEPLLSISKAQTEEKVNLVFIYNNCVFVLSLRFIGFLFYY